MDRRQPRTVLFVQESVAEPFEAPLRFLEQQACVHVVPTLKEAILAVQQPGLIPDLIVITQAYPQSCPSKQLDLLRQRVPLAKIVVLCGIWCEGAGRTARPWPGTIRLYWHQFPARISNAWLRGQYDPFWSLPATSSDTELFLASHFVQGRAMSSVIAIAAGTRSAYDALAEICQRAGNRTYWVHPRRSQPGHAIDCGIWDDSLAGSLDWPTFQQQIQPAPLILLCNFPRIDQQNRAMGSVPSVLGKPFLCRDLIQLMARLHEPAPPQPTTRAA